MQLFSVENILFSILGYDISLIELIGTILYLASVYLVAKRHVLTWPIGIVSVVLYFWLFLQIQLYADALEQIWYFFMGFYGWIHWQKTREPESEDFRFSSTRTNMTSFLLIVSTGIGLSFLIARLDNWFPSIFPEPASYVLVDSLTTTASFLAMYLLAKKRAEAWFIWIAVDLIAIWLYILKGVIFLSLLYVILTVIAYLGLRDWTRKIRSNNRSN